MQGFSLTLLKLDDELKELLDAPADTRPLDNAVLAEIKPFRMRLLQECPGL